MKILPLHRELERYITKKGLSKKYHKQKTFFEKDPFHPGLNTELLEPREMRIWSFRIDRKYRVLFIFHNKETVEIIDINNHYQ